MAEFGVGFKLFADSSQFQRELKEATESAKNVQRGLKDIGLNIGGLLGIGAVTNAFLSTVNAAQQLRDEAEKVGRAVDSSVQSVANLGDSLDLLKNGARDLSINTLGVFTKLGEKLGDFALRLGEGLTQAQIDNNAKISADAEKNIAKMAAARENYATKLAEADEKLAASQRENAIKRAGDEDKLNALLQEHIRLQGVLEGTAKNTVKNREAQIAVENSITAIVTERDRIAKRTIDEQAKADKEREKATADAQKIQDEYQKKIRLGRDEEIEFTRLQLKGAENLNRDERARFELLTLQTKQKQIQVEIDTIMAIPVAERTEADKRALSLLFQQSDNLGKQIAQRTQIVAVTDSQVSGEKKVTTELVRQNSVIAARLQTSKNFENASDESLKELARRNRQQASDARNPALGGGNFNGFFASILELNAKAAEDELKFRESLRRDVKMFGEDTARRNFKGDPLKFDALMQQYVTDTRTLQEIQKESTSELKDLNARLSKFGFTK